MDPRFVALVVVIVIFLALLSGGKDEKKDETPTPEVTVEETIDTPQTVNVEEALDNLEESVEELVAIANDEPLTTEKSEDALNPNLILEAAKAGPDCSGINLLDLPSVKALTFAILTGWVSNGDIEKAKTAIEDNMSKAEVSAVNFINFVQETCGS